MLVQACWHEELGSTTGYSGLRALPRGTADSTAARPAQCSSTAKHVHNRVQALQVQADMVTVSTSVGRSRYLCWAAATQRGAFSIIRRRAEGWTTALTGKKEGMPTQQQHGRSYILSISARSTAAATSPATSPATTTAAMVAVGPWAQQPWSSHSCYQ